MNDSAPFSPFSPSIALSLGFATVLLISIMVKMWLASRQIRHVAQHRHAVPAAFTGNITLGEASALE